MNYYILNSVYNNMSISENSYIGKKGYVVKKSSLSPQQIKKIQDDLNVKPFIVASMGGGGQNLPFPCYRESEKKLYLPRFYGVREFGDPVKSQLNDFESIDLEFPNEFSYESSGILRLSLKYPDPPHQGYIDLRQKKHL